MILQLNSLRKKQYQAITGQPGMAACLANGRSLSGSDFGITAVHPNFISESLNNEPERPVRTKYALSPPAGNPQQDMS